MAIGIGLGLSGLGSAISGLFGSSASKKASSTQSQASELAAYLTYQMYNQTAARLQPWVTTGEAANTQLAGLLGLSGYQASGAGGLTTGALTTPFQPTMAQLAQTPGYQFTLQQGEQAVQNAAAAQGLGQSGAALKGITSYAEGLASTTYQQQFQNYWTQLSNIYNMLSGASSTGAQAATGTGQFGTSAASSAGNYLTSGAAASAAGTIGSTSALTSSLSSLSSLPLTYSLLSAAQQGQYATAAPSASSLLSYPSSQTTAATGVAY